MTHENHELQSINNSLSARFNQVPLSDHLHRFVISDHVEIGDPI